MQIIVFILSIALIALIYLGRHILGKYKLKVKPSYILILALFLALLLLPFFLNILFTYVPDRYFPYSAFEKKDWFSFIGGYAGTVIM